MAVVETVIAGANILSKLFGGEERGPDDPYTIPCNGGMTVTRRLVDEARSANLPGIPAFDGKGGWSNDDCTRISALMAAKAAGAPAASNPYPAAEAVVTIGNAQYSVTTGTATTPGTVKKLDGTPGTVTVTDDVQTWLMPALLIGGAALAVLLLMK